MSSSTAIEHHTLVVDGAANGRRLDAYLAERLPRLSRSRVQALIKAGCVSVEPAADAPPGDVAAVTAGRDRLLRAADRVRAGDRVTVLVPPPTPTDLLPEAIPLTIVYQDEHLLVVDKPAGLTVHPGAGRRTGTLVHAILAHFPDLPGIGGEQRPGIVHRLDKDTSGLLVVARNEPALHALQAQIQARRVRRTYLALVHGRLTRSHGVIEAPIGRDPRHRTRMAVVASGRRAVTHFRVLEAFEGATMLEVHLETGRTHQIRVHCAHLGHPVVGDRTYGRRGSSWGMRRQALHACRLAFEHPITGQPLEFTSPLPADIEGALALLRADTAGGRPAIGV